MNLERELKALDQWEVVVEYHESIPSTQLRARELAGKGCLKAIVVAEEQTAGRGRLVRRWESPKGSGLYFSILFRPCLPPAAAYLVNVAAALSVAESVESLLGLDLRLKWPNDLLLPQESSTSEDKKVCGILSESATRKGAIDYCVTGIGLNLYEPPFLPPEVAARAGWLRRTEKTDEAEPNEAKPNKAKLNEAKLLARIVNNFFRRIDALEHEGTHDGTSPMLKIYRERCASVGRILEVETGEETLRGLCLGIGDQGELILETSGGSLRRFHVADVVHARLGSGIDDRERNE
jgi:BirA family biotin operon repressor/biotin-[acetyl-CoA-carboxylase] ligase